MNPTPESPTPTDKSLLRRLTAGQPRAADDLYHRYAERIRALARARLPQHVAARLDPDDVVQSVFRAFFESAKQGLYQVPDGETLWQLLAVVTVNKVRSLHAFHAAARRDARATVGWEETDGGGSDDDLMALAIRDVFERLPEPERVAIELRVEGYEVAEIATRTGRSKRSVERSLQKARERLAALLEPESARDGEPRVEGG
ncbi:MAG TPA: sigma-70 family RNA polymerase sigma factor [Gemmataceae bacterium]|jgi:RNA polymerase sigma-70 factor (ECF subfamily)|nr:sigma-70 family RNA polymerase sigma factor [Gemmataceae bacterium]